MDPNSDNTPVYMDLLSFTDDQVVEDVPLYPSPSSAGLPPASMLGGVMEHVEEPPLFRSLAVQAPVDPLPFGGGHVGWGAGDLSMFPEPVCDSQIMPDFKGLVSSRPGPRVFDENEHQACHTRIHMDQNSFQAFDALLQCCGSPNMQLLNQNSQDFFVEAQALVDCEHVVFSATVFAAPSNINQASILVFSRISGGKSAYINLFRTVRSSLCPVNSSFMPPPMPDHCSNHIEREALEVLLEMAEQNQALWAQQQTCQTLAQLSQNTENLKQLVELDGIRCILSKLHSPCSHVQICSLHTLLHLAQCQATKEHLRQHVTQAEAQQMLGAYSSAMSPAVMQVASQFVEALA